MKTLGLIGGMSWESSAQYYRLINQGVRDRLGQPHSAQLVMASVDFAPIVHAQHEGRWDDAGQIIIEAAQALERAGAQVLVLCTNTMHKLADQITAATTAPLLHIADPVGERAVEQGWSKVGLLGTAFTMEQDFLKVRLKDRFGLEIKVPPAEARARVHQIIYEELCAGVITPASRAFYIETIEAMAREGVQAVILGCTEIGLLIGPEDSPLPLLDTTLLHALAAVDVALN